MTDGTTRSWNFLLPETGSHEFRVENIGVHPGQKAFIDGVALDAPDGTTVFTGPGASLLELRKGQAKWQLAVNGFVVEDYNAGHHRKGEENTMRELRSMPEGSYTIATKFTAEAGGLKVVRKFRFLVQGEVHDLEISHANWIWHVIYNGQVLDRLTHSMWEDKCDKTFAVSVGDSMRLDAELRMEWVEAKRLWTYALAVNHIPVPTFWTSATGCDKNVVPPEVLGGQGATTSGLDAADLDADQGPVAPPPDVELPQGVSYDAEHKCYQANIMVRGRFLFLGEFRTPEEAAARYMEEFEKKQPRS